MKKILFIFLMLFTSLSFAVAPEAGVNFDKTVQTVPTDNKDKIEVTELFWYGCIHCYQMDPMLSDWVKKLPKDVYFKRMPAIPRPDWHTKNPAPNPSTAPPLHCSEDKKSHHEACPPPP